MRKYGENFLVGELKKSFPDIGDSDLGDSIKIITEYIAGSLRESRRVEIRKFGNFSIRLRKKQGKEELFRTIYSKITSPVE